MLRLRVEADAEQPLAGQLARHEGVRRLISTPAISGGVVLEADVDPVVADEIVAELTRLEVEPAHYVLTRLDLVAPAVRQGAFADLSFSWIDILGSARTSSWLLGRYVTLMSVAGVIAGLGVIKGNGILIVGAMAVSPDLLPLCAACVGIVGRRPHLTRRALITLAVGLAVAGLTATLMTVLLEATGLISTDFKLGAGGLGTLASADYSTVLIALAAGIAAMLSFETRASAAVGVAISVTTIPASAYWGVAVGSGLENGAWGALLVLVINVTLLLISGSATLVLQTRMRHGRQTV